MKKLKKRVIKRKIKRLERITATILLGLMFSTALALLVSAISWSSGELNITSPNATYNLGYYGFPLYLNYTLNHSQVQSCWYEYNNTNTSIACASPAGEVLQDNYQTDTQENGFTSASWLGQGFTASDNYCVNTISLKTRTTASSTTRNISLWNSGTDYKPTSIISSNLSIDTSASNWKNATFPSMCLSKGNNYTIVLFVQTGDNGAWRSDDPTAGYTNGDAVISLDSGGSWSASSLDRDFLVFSYTYGTGLSKNISFNQTDYNKRSLNLYANDTGNNLIKISTTWDYNIYENSQIFNSSTYETASESFTINLSYNSSRWVDLRGDLFYNGTLYSGTKTGSGDNILIASTINIPSVSVAGTKEFKWLLSLYNSTGITYINSTSNSQTVGKLYFGECSPSYLISMNFTAYDEENLTRLNPFDFFYSTFRYGVSTILKTNTTFYNQTLAEKDICISPNSTSFYVDSDIEYGLSTYVTRNYFMENYITDNVTDSIPLYLLLDSSATTFIIKVQDINLNPITNALVYIQRYYPQLNEYRTVQIARTDSNGKSVGFYKAETAEYRHIIIQNGTTLLTTGKSKVFGESVPYTLTFTIGESISEPWLEIQSLSNLIENLSYNNATKIFTFTYSDTSNNFTLGRLLVTKSNYNQSATTVCNVNSSIESSSLTCDISSYSSGDFTAKAYITRGNTEYYVDSESVSLESGKDVFGRLGLFLAWLIILTCAMIGLYSESLITSIWLVNVAVILVNLISLASFSPIYIFGMIAISLIITVVMKA